MATSTKPDSPGAIGADLIDTLRTVNTLLLTDGGTEEGLYKVVTDALTRLGLRGSVMLREHDDLRLTVRHAVTHALIRRVELMSGLRTVGHVIDGARVAVYRSVLTSGQAEFVEDSYAVLEELVAETARPFISLLRTAFEGHPAIYAPLRSRGEVVGVLNASGSGLTRADLPAFDVLAKGLSLGLAHLELQRGRSAVTVRRPVASEISNARALAEQRAALDHHAIVTITDLKGRITYANDRFCALSGYSRDELLGHTHHLVNSGHHPPEFFAAMWKTIGSGQVWQGELCNRAKDGHTYWLAATIVPLVDAAGRPREYIAFRTDISAQKAAEVALRQALEGADAANRAKGTFLANMSHEIRTPMNAILGLTRHALGAGPENAREDLELVVSAADGLLTTLNDILDFSKIEAGKLTLEERGFDLPEELEKTLKIFAPLAQQRAVRLEWQVEEGARDRVVGDPHRLRQVLNNIVGNALKFTARGSVTVTARRLGDLVQFSVKDTGPGIPTDKLDQVFQAFEQADTSTTRRYGGTGLGLSIARSLTRLMGGDLVLISAPGEGTTADITVRLLRASLEEEAGSDTAVPLRPLRVLIAEDNLINQRVAQRLLERWNCSVEVVGDGAAAASRALEGDFDVVLMDLNMPVMSGLDATRRIRQQEGLEGRHVRIIAVTANAMMGDREQCLAAGMDDYVSKPIRAEVLHRALALVPPRTRAV